MVMKSRAHHASKKIPGPRTVPASSLRPADAEARPLSPGGSYVANMGQSGLISSCMPLTTPARANKLASCRGASAEPWAYTSAPFAVTPTAERHWCSMPGTLEAHELAPQVAPHSCQSALAARAVGRPPATSGTRFWRTATTLGVILTSRPHAPTLMERSEEHTSELQSLRHLVC